MTPLIERLKTWWREADKTQKTVSVVGTAFLLLLLGGVFYFSSRPQLAILFADLAPGQLAAVQGELDKQGVKYEIDASRTVYVSRSEVTKLQAKLSAAGVAPDIDKFGYRDLSDIGMMNSPAVEGTKINAIHEGVLADMIGTLDAVDEAIVRISPMDDSPFAVERRPATASVLVRERRGQGATSDLGSVIAGMVANSVQGLGKDSITVSTTEGRLLYDGQMAGGSTGMVSEKIAAQREEADRKRRELQAQLDTAFGRGTTVVQVMVEMDFDKSSVTEEKRTPSESPVSSRSISENLTGEGKSPSGVTGLETNTPGAPAAGAGSGTDYKSKQESKEFLHDYTKTIREAVPGKIVAMGINVLADSSRIADPAAQTTLENTVRGFLGPMSDPDAFTANVNFVAFDQSADAEVAKMAGERASRDQMQQMFSFLPLAALLLVGLMVVRSVKRVAVTPAAGDFPPVAGPDALGSGDPTAAVAPSILEQLEQGQPRGALSATEASESDRDPDQYDEDYEIEPLELGSKKVNRPLQQIFQLAEQKPEEVAGLVKAWLKEEVR